MRPAGMSCVGVQSIFSASAEGDDAADRIVGGNADGHAIAGNDLDAEAAHAAAQLREDLVTLIALHAIEPAAVDGHDRTLNIYQIVLAQMCSFLQSIIVPQPSCNHKART